MFGARKKIVSGVLPCLMGLKKKQLKRFFNLFCVMESALL
jgi:hypothetical protein